MDKVTRYGAEMAEMKEGKDAMTKVAKYEVERNRVADALEAIAETNARVLELYEKLCREHTRFTEIDERNLEIQDRELELREVEIRRAGDREFLGAKFKLQQLDLLIKQGRNAISETEGMINLPEYKWDAGRLRVAIKGNEFRLAQLELERKQLLEAHPKLATSTSTND